MRKDLKKEGVSLDEMELMDLEEKVEDLDQSINNPSYLDMEPTEIGSRLSIFMNSAQRNENIKKELPSPKISSF